MKEEETIDLIHFHNGSGGGVLSVIQNLISYSVNPKFRHHLIHIINRDQYYNHNHNLLNLETLTSEKVFYYRSDNNFYSSCNRLRRLLVSSKSIIIAHDWYELGLVSNLGLENPVVFFLHGDYDYYYDLALRHKNIIDQYVAVSDNIARKLRSRLGEHLDVINSCRFPVPYLGKTKTRNSILNVFYCVRSLNDDNKQYHVLPKINKILEKHGVKVNWVIVSQNTPVASEHNTLWRSDASVMFYYNLNNKDVLTLLLSCDIFVLPSIKEGFPVSLVEAMKAGLVPLVTDWDGATSDLVISGKNGFTFKIGDVDAYANCLLHLNENRDLLYEMSEYASIKANNMFNPLKNVKVIEDVFIKAYSYKRNKSATKVYGSNLDQRWIPNIVTTFIRRYLTA